MPLSEISARTGPAIRHSPANSRPPPAAPFQLHGDQEVHEAVVFDFDLQAGFDRPGPAKGAGGTLATHITASSSAASRKLMLAAPSHRLLRPFAMNRAKALQDVVFRVSGVEPVNIILGRTERRNRLAVDEDHEGFEFATDIRVIHSSDAPSRGKRAAGEPASPKAAPANDLEIEGQQNHPAKMIPHKLSVELSTVPLGGSFLQPAVQSLHFQG